MEEISIIRQEISKCMKKRDQLLHSTMSNKPYIAAQVYERYKTCGNKNCKCHNGKPHGPFLWIYQHKKGQKIISTTVNKEKASQAQKLAASYLRWTDHRQQLRELDRLIQENLDKIEKILEQDAREYVTKGKPGRPRKQG
jgi:hypothetical protein